MAGTSPKPSNRHRSSSTGRVLAALVVGGMLAGAVLLAGTHTALRYTERTEFCVSCHEMRDNLYEDYTKSSHFTNASGVQAGCADCHVPEPFGPWAADHFRALGEVYSAYRGKLETPELFDQHRLELAERVWAYMKATDSRECRSCHSQDHMDFALQDATAAEQMQAGFAQGETCIDCHKGIVHQMPDMAKRAREEAIAFMEGTEALDSDRLWTKRTASMTDTPDADGEKIATVVPGVAVDRLERTGDFVRVRVSGWQAGDVARGQYAMFGHRILNLSISGSAVDKVETGESRFYSDGNQDWTETSLEGWVPAADLTADEETLWKIANSMFVSQCGICHSAAAPDSRGVLAWQADVQAYAPRTSLTAEETRFVLRYLQMHSSDMADRTN